MFILSHAIIPVFAFAVLVNFYNFDPTFSIDVPEKFPNCQDCIDSPCHKENNGSCAVNPDNTTVVCITCSDPDGGYKGYKLYALEADCKKKCKYPTNCVCDGKCYICIEDAQPAGTKFVCEMPTFKWDDGCTAMVPYSPPAAPPA